MQIPIPVNCLDVHPVFCLTAVQFKQANRGVSFNRVKIRAMLLYSDVFVDSIPLPMLVGFENASMCINVTLHVSH